MTFAELYRLNDKCHDVDEKIKSKDLYCDEEGNLHLVISDETYNNLKDVLRDCSCLIYDLCQQEVI